MVIALPFVFAVIGLDKHMAFSTIVVILLMGSFGGVMLIELILKRTDDRRNPFFDSLVSVIPSIKDIASAASQARFARYISALYSAGIDVFTTLKLASNATGSARLSSGVGNALNSIDRGENIASSLSEISSLSPVFLSHLSIGAQTGNIDSSIDAVAEQYEEKTLHLIHQFCIKLGVAALLISGTLIGIVVLKFYGALKF